MKTLITWLLLVPSLTIAQIKSPEEFLGYPLGDQFSRHHQVIDYFTYISENSEKVTLQQYGKTYEGRPLILAFVSSVRNQDSIEKIRTDNLRRAGMLEGSPETEVPTVWLSYNVHGNESSSTEAAMATLYELVRPDSDKAMWLEDVVVVMDPCINPDGRDRYVNFYQQNRSFPYNPNPAVIEHNEPWPGGRANHYLFDLNRDWAWQTQVESQSRLKVYNQWLPQIHVDFHEQGINSPYYFAPAAQPFHELITPFQRAFQEEIGRNHAKYFDENNWFYFTKQYFDLLYPSYGDTYPTYNGAIGMTYEQAGGGRGGLGVIKQEGDTLTLRDRIAHHYTTGLSTIEIAAYNKDRLLTQFRDFFGDNAALKYKTFVLRSGNNQDKLNALSSWLDLQGIRYGSASGGTKLKAYDYQTGTESTISIRSGDLIISTDQPKATLAHILFEPKTKLVDSMTYDITAWSVPYAYGIEAYASQQQVSTAQFSRPDFVPQEAPEKVYAFISKWNSIEDAKFLAAMLKKGIKARVTQKPITHEGVTFDRGSIIITKRDNVLVKNFESAITALANEVGRKLSIVSTGFMDAGPDIGSSDIRFLKTPKVALLSGVGTSSLAVGATWHFMEQELEYPLHRLDIDYLMQVDMSNYDVIIMQDGRYSSFGSAEMERISEWVKSGGRLIVVGDALEKWKDSDYSSLKTYLSDSEKEISEALKEERETESRFVPFKDRRRDYIKGLAQGAIYRVKMDRSHPLAFGYEETYYTLKDGSARIAYLASENVGVIERSSDLMSGFVGSYAKKDVPESLVLGVENRGRGQIVYMVDNPLYRSFWQNGKLLFVNAIFYVGQ